MSATAAMADRGVVTTENKQYRKADLNSKRSFHCETNTIFWRDLQNSLSGIRSPTS